MSGDDGQHEHLHLAATGGTSHFAGRQALTYRSGRSASSLFSGVWYVRYDTILYLSTHNNSGQLPWPTSSLQLASSIPLRKYRLVAVLRGGEATAEGCVVCLFSSLLVASHHNSTSTSLKTLLSATL